MRGKSIPNISNAKLPSGFQVCGVCCGIKGSNKLDLGVIVSQIPALTFGAFTSNDVKAPPVIFCKNELQKSPHVSHVLINSGIANACTGNKGEQSILTIKKYFTRRFKTEGSFLMCSTGIIGAPLPVQKIKKGIRALALSIEESSIDSFNQAIMTTDTFAKNEFTAIKLRGRTIKISGFCKGAGMINPHMATMLAFILTDLALPKNYSAKFLGAVDHSFNSISVDGDMSTNDSVLLMSNGSSSVKYTALNKREKLLVDETLQKVFQGLARKIVRDGEGATKLIEIKIKNARSVNSAKKIAETIANSPLVKTAFFGSDPNWGRIIAAIGSVQQRVNEAKLSIKLGSTIVYSRGSQNHFDQAKLSQELKKREVKLTVDLAQGISNWTYWTCDLTYEYIKLNAEYHT